VGEEGGEASYFVYWTKEGKRKGYRRWLTGQVLNTKVPWVMWEERFRGRLALTILTFAAKRGKVCLTQDIAKRSG